MGSHRRVEWAIEAASLGACAALISEDRATIHEASFSAGAATIAGLVVGADIAALVARMAPSRLAPVCLMVLLPGLVESSSARVSVWTFAFAALLPLAVIYATRTRVASPVLPTVVAVVGSATVFARISYREPFRELRCEPACVFNPDLLTHAPHIVRGAEWALALAVALWAVLALASVLDRRTPDVQRHGASPVVALAVLALLWAGRLAQQPRPLPDDAYDRSLFVASLAAIGIAALLRGLSATRVALARWRITRDARSLSHAATLESITQHLRHATGDQDLCVRLGADTLHGAEATSVLRGGRVVASIEHRLAARQRVAVAVTPAIASALETQLLLAEARAHVAELERSRALIVDTTDTARRRLERDLHDGAQQRLLVVGMRLAHAADERPTSDSWRIAVTHVADALAELRRIGRGEAAIIAELGLEDAMTALAGVSRIAVRERTIRCAQRDHDCWPQTTATAIYRLVVGSIADAERMSAEELAVELRCLGEGHGHTVHTCRGGTGQSDRLADHDRVVAGGGRIVMDNGGVFEAWLP